MLWSANIADVSLFPSEVKIMRVVLVIITISVTLTGCSEHPLCEKWRSLVAQSALKISDTFKEGGSVRDANSAVKNLEEARDVAAEIKMRNISCKNID